MQGQNDTVHVLENAKRLPYALVLNGLLVGVLAGGVAVIYRLLLEKGEAAMRWALGLAQDGLPGAAAWFLGLAVLGGVAGLLVRWEPLISGSGIPQVSGEMKGYLDPCWYRVLAAKLVGGTLCALGGLSMGREGPSVQLGGMVGKGVSRLLHRVRTEEKYLITCGAGAGLAAAFNAPLAGVLFALEEIHKNFSAAALVSVMTAAVAADFLSKLVFGMTPVFTFALEGALPLEEYWLLVILGVLLGALGAFYNFATLKVQALYGRSPLPEGARVVVPFLLAGVLGFWMPQVLGGGHAMVELLYGGDLLLGGMLALLAVKFLFSLLSFGSGAPGGIFFPLLVLGAYMGGSFGLVAIRYCGVSPESLNNFIILAMAGYFTAIVRAPVTGVVLIAEMTGSFSHLLSLSVVSVVAYVTAYLLRSAPIYESLLGNILKKRGIAAPQETGEKILTTAVVQLGAAVAGQPVHQLHLPAGCLLVAVRRGGQELIPRGDTVLMEGDTLVALAGTEQYAAVKAELQELCAAEPVGHQKKG